MANNSTTSTSADSSYCRIERPNLLSNVLREIKIKTTNLKLVENLLKNVHSTETKPDFHTLLNSNSSVLALTNVISLPYPESRHTHPNIGVTHTHIYLCTG